MVIANADLDDNQHISVMAATTLTGLTLNGQSMNDKFLAAITYSLVASVIRQCENSQSISPEDRIIVASTVAVNGQNRGYGSGQRPSKAEYETFKMKHPCNLCGHYGHWLRDHNDDGSLPATMKSVSSKRQSFTEADVAEKKHIVSCNTASLVGSTASTRPSSNERKGPLVDDGAPY